MKPEVEAHGEIVLMRVVRPEVALGMALHILSLQPPLNQMQVVHLVRAVREEILRGHYWLAFNRKEELVGFIGWALPSQKNAEA